MPVSMIAGGQVYYLAYDQVGSLRAVFDSAGSEVKRVDYDSFGNILSDSNPAFSVLFGFAGGLHDLDTGLVRFGARDYDPATGKWTAKDPIDFAGGDLNLGSYVGQDPVNWVDPEGELASIIGGVIGGGIAGGLAGAIVGAVGSAFAGNDVSGILKSLIIGGVAGAIVGGVAGGAAGAGIVGPLGLAAGDFWAGFNFAIGIGESASLSSILGAVAGALADLLIVPEEVDGYTTEKVNGFDYGPCE